jgi:hypothetical protein
MALIDGDTATRGSSMPTLGQPSSLILTPSGTVSMHLGSLVEEEAAAGVGELAVAEMVNSSSSSSSSSSSNSNNSVNHSSSSSSSVSLSSSANSSHGSSSSSNRGSRTWT